MFKHAGIILTDDIEDGAWDDEAETLAHSRFDHIPTPAGRKMCRCGAKDIQIIGEEPFCQGCLNKIRECWECGHHGTQGDFNMLFDDECCEVCPACGEHDTARKPIWVDGKPDWVK